VPLADVEKKVMAAAEKEAREIIAKAEAEARAELERRSAALREEHQRRLAVAKAEADAAVERAINTRKAEQTQRVLQAKNDILDALFDAVRERALASQGFDYGRWLAAQVRQVCEEGAGTLYCAERDREAVEAVVREAGGGKVQVAPEPGLMRGGVYLVGEGFDLDLTLEATLADLRHEHTIALAERLFDDVPPIGLEGQQAGE